MITKQEALNYHSQYPTGKIAISSTKPCKTQKDLAMAYTPGVAEPCLEIHKDPAKAAIYTAKSHLVAVITNGTAVLGLGNIGPLAGKPVMEGKGVLFKEFADIDVFDLELNENDPQKIVDIVKALEPTFGGINLEDIKAPECFEIERKLIECMNIPVFHDDQHGTAIISTAAFINAIELVKKKAGEVKVVFSGAGAAAIACAKMLLKVGVTVENTYLCDTKGLVTKDRPTLDVEKGFFAKDTKMRTMAEAIKGADVFIGLSVKGALSKEMLASMAPNAIVFAMANPDPEIGYHDALSVRKDLIFATGRSDYPNQVNNVLGFPFIFRGALDTGATKITEEMKLAASKALAALAREPVPRFVCDAYNLKTLHFGPDYIIPKPFDPRVLLTVTPAVAKAAMESGVATRPIKDLQAYQQSLFDLLKSKGRIPTDDESSEDLQTIENISFEAVK